MVFLRCPLSFEVTSFAGEVVSPAAGKLKRKRQNRSNHVREYIKVLSWMLLGSGHCRAATPDALSFFSRTMPHLIERHKENCDEGQHHSRHIVFAGNLFIDQQRDNDCDKW